MKQRKTIQRNRQQDWELQKKEEKSEGVAENNSICNMEKKWGISISISISVHTAKDAV